MGRWFLPVGVGVNKHPPRLWRQHTSRGLAFAVCIQWALMVAACGDDTSNGPPTRGSTVAECDDAGINEHAGRQGTCIIGDVKRTVANRRGRLVLDDDIEIRLREFVVEARGRDRLVLASLRVKNLRARPLRWPASARQVALWVNRRLISQGPHQRSLALRAIRPSARPRVTVGPGDVATVAAGWRLSRATAAGLRRRGSAIIAVPPGGGSEWVEGAARIGVLRL
ncbi:MAG: hypothetical protein LC808_25145 [Actinobacteria bacterium]|nr:hypothetical protein [Actinomycetota bacterium]